MNLSEYEFILIEKYNDDLLEDMCELAIVHKNDDEYISYTPVNFYSPSELKDVYNNVINKPINTFFYENGTFYIKNGRYYWEKVEKSDKTYTVSIDFDGVINSYTSGFISVDIIPDVPVTGAFEFIEMVLKHNWKVVIFSTRNKHPNAVKAIKDWFLRYKMKQEILDQLEFPIDKPIARIYIDDRGYKFEGIWPTMSELKEFYPWHGGESSSGK